MHIWIYSHGILKGFKLLQLKLLERKQAIKYHTTFIIIVNIKSKTKHWTNIQVIEVKRHFVV